MDRRNTFYASPTNPAMDIQEGLETAAQQKQQNQWRNLNLATKWNRPEYSIDWRKTTFETLKNAFEEDDKSYDNSTMTAEKHNPNLHTNDSNRFLINTQNASKRPSFNEDAVPNDNPSIEKDYDDDDAMNRKLSRRCALSPLQKTSPILSAINQKYSFNNSTPRSKEGDSSIEFIEETSLREENHLSNSMKINSALLAAEAIKPAEDDADPDDHEQYVFQDNTFQSNKTSRGKAPESYICNGNSQIYTEDSINFIMLMGLFMGFLISKSLQYLQLYFSWFLSQIMQLRNGLLGSSSSTSIWDFLNIQDDSNIQKRTKLLLLPLILAIGILYWLMALLQWTIRVLLTPAPRGLVNFIQSLQRN